MSNYTSNRFFGSYSALFSPAKVSLASVASPAETVVLIQPLLCFAPLLHPPRLSCVGTTSSALQQENSIVGRQKLFNYWNSCRPDPCNVTRNRRNTLFCSLSARRVLAGLRLCRGTTARAHDDTERRIDGRAAPLAHPRVCTLNSQNSSKGVFFTTLVTATVISFPAN